MHGIDAIVNASMGICRRAFERRVTLDTSFDGDPPSVCCNPVQLEQVLVNLLLNARDAVLEAGRTEARVYVRVRRTTLARAAATTPPVASGARSR